MTSPRVEWPADFTSRHGRAPRVLHVGNIGNNAYLNARFLRAAGVECDVLCFDYYDALATPEWEGHRRPPWFVQGPLGLCAAYLQARHEGDRRAARLLGARLRASRAVPPRLRLRTRELRIRLAATRAGAAAQPVTGSPAAAEACPDDAEHFRPALPIWRRLFARYDVVQCYSTDPIWAYLADARPYVAYEHGTLRVFTSGTDPLSRLTALAYRESDHTFITNGDCLPHAERIGIPRYSPMIHPLDVVAHEADARREAAEIRRSLGADVLLFCPMRHDWEIKGTDVHLRALPGIVERAPGRVVLALVEWGGQVAESKELTRSLGCAGNVAWLPRLNRPRFIHTLKAADAVLDQMTLPHLDATTPQAIAAGTPVIGSYEPESTAWIVDEPAPVLSAFSPEEVAERVLETLDPAWRTAFRESAREWTHRHHHPRRIVSEHVRVYSDVLDRHGRPREASAAAG